MEFVWALGGSVSVPKKPPGRCRQSVHTDPRRGAHTAEAYSPAHPWAQMGTERGTGSHTSGENKTYMSRDTGTQVQGPQPWTHTHRYTNTEASTERSKGLADRQGHSQSHSNAGAHRCGHRHARMPGTRTWVETRRQAHACTPAQHSSVLRKGDPDTHPEQKHSRAQTHPAFRHSHTL